MPSKIEWTDEVWNPVTGCTPISEGCAHCYAQRMATRLRGRAGYDAENPFLVTIHRDRFGQPLRWRKPRHVFVCSMGDLFHKDVDNRTIDLVFAVMACSDRHTYQVLTKRPERMSAYVARGYAGAARAIQWLRGEFEVSLNEIRSRSVRRNEFLDDRDGWPPKNVWLGVTAENQARADERIPILLDTPAAVRFVSVEPMLGPVDIRESLAVDWRGNNQEPPDNLPALDWVICGGEAGPGARPMHPDWARSLRDQCQEAGVPFFFKKHGDYNRRAQGEAYISDPANTGRMLDGREWNQFPGEDLS